MKYIDRSKSLITGKDNLEHLYTFKKFPVFLGCVKQDLSKDLLADMSWSICPETGIIQLDKVLPLNILYQLPHNDGVGKIWENYYIAFAKYVKAQGVKNILEIGGGGGKVAKIFTNICKESKYYMVEPNPLIKSDKQIEVIKEFFDENFSFNKNIDAIIHSQVFEHAYNPIQFILNISNFLKKGQKHIMAFPDIEWFIKNNYTNGMNFEHTFLLNENFADFFFIKAGFKIIDKTRYKGYDLFYTLEKIEVKTNNYNLTNNYIKYKNLFLGYINYHNNLILSLNKKMKEYNGKIYLFGAHIFSQYLLGFGLNQNHIFCILDNSNLKNKKRLYGSKFIVEKPDIIKGQKKVAVILKAAIYQEEIRKQLLTINPNVEIWE